MYSTRVAHDKWNGYGILGRGGTWLYTPQLYEITKPALPIV